MLIFFSGHENTLLCIVSVENSTIGAAFPCIVYCYFWQLKLDNFNVYLFLHWLNLSLPVVHEYTKLFHIL
jgi:hypothetical protein